MTIEYIPLKSLSASKDNVRKAKSDAGIQELKASIMAHGLLQNLSVIKTGEGAYTVVAGNRRLQALQELFKEGKISDESTVTCRVMTAEQAQESSIAENVMREAMHPADEYAAFSALEEKGVTTDDIALRFGYEEKHIVKILKLGNVHATILQAFRAGEIDLEDVQAFTLADSKEQQLKTYNALKKAGRVSDYWIRESLLDKTINAIDRRVRFVTIEAYEEEGGKIQTDLFANETHLLNAEILTKLFDAKLQAKLDKLKEEGWGWTHIEEKEWEDHSFLGRYEKIKKSDAPMDKSECGVYLRIDSKGSLQLTFLKGKKKDEKKKGKEGYSQSLIDDLKAYRMQIAQAEIAAQPDLAIDLLLMQAYSGHHVTDDDTMLNYIYTGAAISFTQQSGTQRVQADEDTKANQALLKLQNELPLGWLKHEEEIERFQALQALNDSEKFRLLAYAVARTLRPQLQDFDHDDHYEEALHQAGNVVPQYWRPTRENFLSRINASDLLAIIEEIFGKSHAKLYQAKPKKVLVALLHDAFAAPDKASVDMHIQHKLRQWLPKGMTFEAPLKTIKEEKAKKKSSGKKKAA